MNAYDHIHFFKRFVSYLLFAIILLRKTNQESSLIIFNIIQGIQEEWWRN